LLGAQPGPGDKVGVTSSAIDWYAARAAGIVAYLILTTVVLVGLTLSGQVRLPRWPRFAITDVHRFGGLLVGVFVSIHIATIALDSYVPFSFTQLVVPLTSHYRPVWTALGIVAAELLVALALTNLLRGRVPYRFWRRIHVLNFVVWGAATAHGIGSGTDTGSTWMVLIYLISVSGVLGALAWRLTRRRLAASTVRGLTASAGLLGVAAVLTLTSAPHGNAAHRVLVAPPATFVDTFSGSLAQQEGPGGSLLSIIGSTTGSRRLLLRVDLVSTEGRSISNTALQLKDITSGYVCSGTVSTLTTTGFTGTCSFSGDNIRTVVVSWRLSGQRVTGTLKVNA
jgi:hypothetical protein